MPQGLTDDWLVNIGSENGLVLPANKPLPETMLTQTCVAIKVCWYCKIFVCHLNVTMQWDNK